MKLVKLGMVCGALLVAACGGDDGAVGPAGEPGAAGPAGPAGPAGSSGGSSSGGAAGAESVNGISPGRSFPGRTVRLSISGDNTNWTTAPTVTVDDAAVTASNVTVGSPTSLVLELKIGADATLGEKTITVGDKAIKGFRVEPALDTAFLGSPDQGAILFGALRNRDVENPFSSTSELVSSNAGVTGQFSEVEPNLLQPNVFIDADATGTASFGVKDGFTDIESFGAEPLTIKARQPVAITEEETTIAVGANFASSLYSFDGAGGANGALVELSVFPADDAPTQISPLAVKLSSTGKWADGFEVVSDPILVLARPGANAGGLLTVLDNSGAGGYNLIVTKTATAFGGKEAEPNDASTTATALTLATNTFGELPTEDDSDWYSVTVPVNNKLTVVTTGVEFVTIDGIFGPQPAGVDTAIRIYGSGDTDTPIASSPDTGTNETITTAALPAGTYLIQVDTSAGYYLPGAFGYQIRATVAP